MKPSHLLLLGLTVAVLWSELADGARRKKKKKKGKRRIPFCGHCGKANPPSRRRRSGVQPRRVVGGVETAPHEFPWMVVIGTRDEKARPYINKESTICGASVISHRWLISAAHCFYDEDGDARSKDDLSFVASVHDIRKINKKPKAKYLPIKRIVVHPSYKKKKSIFRSYDVALVELKNKIKKWTRKLQPLCLSKGTENGYAGKDLWYTGWGHLNPRRRNLSPVLQKVKVKGITRKQCMKQNKGTEAADAIFSYHVCTHAESKDSCQGDSGGPILKKIKKDRYKLAGIVSGGMRCASDYPGIGFNPAFLRVTKWILKTTKGDPPCVLKQPKKK